MPATWRAAVAGIDLFTAVCAAVNLAYFCYRLTVHPPEAAARRAAVFVLAVVSLGAVMESAALLAAATTGPPVDSPKWVVVRGLALAGALGTAVLVLRRVRAG